MANESASDQVAMTGLANDLGLDTGDGWALIPYGEWPHAEGIQRFDRAAADQMVTYFKNPWNRIKRALVGMPIFKGHPDLAALANQYPDKATYGQIFDVEARDAGLAMRLVLSEAGAALVNEQGLTKFSPHWLAKTIGEQNGRKLFAPVFLKSIGLTDRPNIAGVSSLVNTSPNSDLRTSNSDLPSSMNQYIIALLAALGRPLANEATETELTEGLQAAVPVATALLARPETTALANEQTRANSLALEIENQKSKIQNAETALANERTALAAAVDAHAATLVQHAVTAGRITEAQQPVWLARLKRDFATEAVALANEQPVVKTASRTAALGQRKEPSEASAKFTALVNEAMPKHGNNYTAAWTAVKATKEGAALIEQMNTKSA